MVGYNWDKQKINNLKERLNMQIKLGEKDAEIDLRTLKMMFGEYDSKNELFIKPSLETIDKITKLSQDFYQKSLNNSDMYQLNRSNMNINDFLALIHDFYKTCSPFFYEFFLKEFNKRNTNLQIKYSFCGGGEAYHLLTTSESFIEVFFDNTVGDLVLLAHEYGHALTFLINKYFTLNRNFIFIREIDGYYFQTRFLNYLIANNIYKKEAIFAKALEDYSMKNKARFLAHNLFDLKAAAILYSYLASIELAMVDSQMADDILERIIKENPQTIEEGMEILKPDIIIGKSIDDYQRILSKQLSEVQNLN